MTVVCKIVMYLGVWHTMSCTLTCYLLFLLPNAVTSSTNLPAIMVTSNIITGEIVCPGDIIIFMCTTTGSAIISWTGNDYVGDQIGFNTANTVGETRQGSANPNTIATLINNTIDDTTQLPVLVSQLQITVSTISSNQSVICVHNSNGIREPTTFQVIGIPSKYPT